MTRQAGISSGSLLLTFCSFLYLLQSVAGQMDRTIIPEERGSDVVDAVVSKIRFQCILADDKLFLRRLAYVESHDGNDPKTYRPNYDGGIWQVDYDMFNVTVLCPAVISQECSTIKKEFNIDWTKVRWSDLRKPLYSALAAALYLKIRLPRGQTIPGGLSYQSDFWSHYYHLGSPVNNFTTTAALLTSACDARVDLVFVLDSSGSIVRSDYQLMLQFVDKLVQQLNIGPDHSQVGAVVYGSTSMVSFYLNAYHNKTSLSTAIQAIVKDDGGTDTASALNLALDRVFSPKYGAREGVSKVLLLLTDGASNSLVATVAASGRLKDAGMNIFTVGVGTGPNAQELNAVASDPSCTHIILLSQGFQDMESILYSLKEDSCKAPVTIVLERPVNTTGGSNQSEPVVHTFNITANLTMKVDTAQGNNSTGDKGTPVMEVKSDCGIVQIFTSYNTPNPSSAFYDVKATTTPGHPAILHFQKDLLGRPFYVTVIGTKLPNSTTELENCNYNVSIFNQAPVDIVCREGGHERKCNEIDLATLCPASTPHRGLEEGVTNPCTPEAIQHGVMVHPYPLDSYYFIKCDYIGDMYITKCPGGKVYNRVTQGCGYESPEKHPVGGVPLGSQYNNPCTTTSILQGLMFFRFSENPHKYIHCDVWGKAWLMDCYPGYIWNEPANSCVGDFLMEFETSTVGPAFHNPCSMETINKGLYFFPYPGDSSRFIHCDMSGNYWIQNCPGGTKYLVQYSTCG